MADFPAHAISPASLEVSGEHSTGTHVSPEVKPLPLVEAGPHSLRTHLGSAVDTGSGALALRYLMTGFRVQAPLEWVTWLVPDTPDTTGALYTGGGAPALNAASIAVVRRFQG